jgi:hypothetical protein
MGIFTLQSLPRVSRQADSPQKHEGTKFLKLCAFVPLW